MKLFAIALALGLTLLSAIAAPAVKLESCPSGTNTTYAPVPTTTGLPIVWSTVPQGDGIGQQYLKCSTIIKASPLTWYVKYSLDNGTTWKWAKLATLTAPTPPAVVPTVATLTWTASTLDMKGNALTVPVTYNLYRGASATALTSLKSGVTGLTTTDTVTVNGTYWYALAAVAAGVEGPKGNPVSAALNAGVVVSPAPPASLTIH